MRNFFWSWGRGKQSRNHSIPSLTIETEPLSWVMSYSSPLGEALHHIVVPPPSQTEGPHLITSTATSPSASTAATQEGILCTQCFPITPTSHSLTTSFWRDPLAPTLPSLPAFTLATKSAITFKLSSAKEVPEHLHYISLHASSSGWIHSLIKAMKMSICFLSFLPEIAQPKYFRGNC